MPNTIFINRKIGLVKEYIQEMDELIKLDNTEIIRNFINLRALERIFQLIVDEMLDINIHFIKELDAEFPDNFQSTFKILAEREIFPIEFAIRIAPVVGLRNKLVHRYEKVSKKTFVEQTKKEYKDFIEYVGYINQYLEKNN